MIVFALFFVDFGKDAIKYLYGFSSAVNHLHGYSLLVCLDQERPGV